MIKLHPDRTSLSAQDLLVLARRGAAHEVNNLLAVIRGNAQLLPSLDADQLRAVCSEIDLACERLGLLSDGWLLADPESPIVGQGTSVFETLHDVVRVVRAAHEVEVRVTTDAAALQQTCGIDDRSLRALLNCTLLSMVGTVNRADIDIRLFGFGAGCTVHLQMPCPPDHRLHIMAPGSCGGAAVASITPGLWDVAQCLARHAGALRDAYHGGVLDLWLDLPPLQT